MRVRFTAREVVYEASEFIVIEPVGGWISVTEEVKKAVTFFDASMIRIQVGAVPEQSPDQEVKVEAGSGVAVRMTEADVKEVEHADPQSIPDGDEVIVPIPVPDLVMARA